MKSTWIEIGISVVVGTFFVWLTSRGVEWEALAAAIAGVDPAHVLAFVLLIVIHLLRVLRWGVLLKPIASVPFGRLFAVSSVGFMALSLLPLRLGELVRPVLIAEHGRIRRSGALATIVAERVVDSLMMAILLVVVLLSLRDRMVVPPEVVVGGWLAFFVFLGALVALVLAYRFQRAAERVGAWILKPLPSTLRVRLQSILNAFLDGLRVLPSVSALGGFLAMTVAYWSMSAFAQVVLFKAFTGLAGLGWVEGATVLSLLCVGLMIPAGPLGFEISDTVKGAAKQLRMEQQPGCRGVRRTFVISLWAVRRRSSMGSSMTPPGRARRRSNPFSHTSPYVGQPPP